MKNHITFTALVLLALLLGSCNALPIIGNSRVITPSDVIISENRDVSDFNAIDFSTFGKVNLIQGDQESLNISGPDNLVPEISTTVRNGTLFIKTNEGITVNPLGNNNPLTFTIVAKDLTGLMVSGAGDVQVDAVTTPNLDIEMSGAGRIQLNQLSTDNLKINLSGVGGLDATGEAQQSTIDISGAGSVNASDLKCQTANITISGLGSVTIWVTDQLSGEISGAGNVSYYGSPQLQTSSSGLGNFNPLGNK